MFVDVQMHNLLDYDLETPHNLDIDYVPKQVQLKNNYSVKQTLMGRRNIGLFLSGGLDSTSILYEMKELGVNLEHLHLVLQQQTHNQNLMKIAQLHKDYAKNGILKTMLPIKHNKIMLTH